MARLPHQRRAAGAVYLVEQRLARLDVGDDGGTRPILQHVARPQDQQLVAPKDAALAIDRADAVAIAVEGDTEVAAAALHFLHQLLEVLRHRRIWMMCGQRAVYLLVQDDVL